MSRRLAAAAALSLIVSLATSGAVLADPDKDESGKGRKREERKVEFWDGDCKVEREYKRGEYKEKRECKERRRARREERDERRLRREHDPDWSGLPGPEDLKDLPWLRERVRRAVEPRPDEPRPVPRARPSVVDPPVAEEMPARREESARVLPLPRAPEPLPAPAPSSGGTPPPDLGTPTWENPQ